MHFRSVSLGAELNFSSPRSSLKIFQKLNHWKKGQSSCVKVEAENSNFEPFLKFQNLLNDTHE